MQAIHLGFEHACAILNNLTVQCWGANYAGQLGDGSYTSRSLPTSVTGVNNVQTLATGLKYTCEMCIRDSFGVEKIVSGSYHVCALSAGKLKCWGRNDTAQLGDGTTSNRTSAVDVLSLSDVKEMIAGDWHTCALLTDQRVKCWGQNEQAQLGIGLPAFQTKPTAVVGLLHIRTISVGERHTCILYEDGVAKCWGSNAYGQLGDGSTLDRGMPVAVDRLTNIQMIAAGDDHTCALLSDQTAVSYTHLL